jgi:hypothetical protein
MDVSQMQVQLKCQSRQSRQTGLQEFRLIRQHRLHLMEFRCLSLMEEARDRQMSTRQLRGLQSQERIRVVLIRLQLRPLELRSSLSEARPAVNLDCCLKYTYPD